jgi:hypothetical protein
MPQPMDHRGFLAISLTSMASMANRVLWSKENTYDFDRTGGLDWQSKCQRFFA